MSKTILIIEDDSALAEVLTNKLHSSGYDVKWVDDGEKGFNKISEIKPDLILLDIMLPSMNGYQILEKKNEDGEIKDIPVIVVSNSGEPVEIERILKLGVKDYLIKAQFDPDEVMTKVSSYLELDNLSDALKSTRILLVEDDDFLSELLSKKLKDKGSDVTHVTNGEAAFEHLEKEVPDLILLDIVLPQMDGYAILEGIRKDERFKNVPVVFLSNLGQKSDIEKGKSLGANKFLVKSALSLDQIIAGVKKVLDTLSDKKK